MTWVTRRVWTDKTTDVAMLLRKHGLSNAQIAVQLGFSSSSVRRYIGRGRVRRTDRVPDILTLKSAGLADKEVAYKLGLTYWQTRAAYRLVPKELRLQYEQVRLRRYVIEFNNKMRV